MTTWDYLVLVYSLLMMGAMVLAFYISTTTAIKFIQYSLNKMDPIRLQFHFEGKDYAFDYDGGGSLCELPDGRLVSLEISETMPPTVQEVTLLDQIDTSWAGGKKAIAI